VYGSKAHRGFESLSLRQIFPGLKGIPLTPRHVTMGLPH
jgi:hypothetical protein